MQAGMSRAGSPRAVRRGFTRKTAIVTMPVPKPTTADLPDAPGDRETAPVAAEKTVRQAVKPAAKRAAKQPAKKPAAAAQTTAGKLVQMGLARDIDFALHLPMRYEDETELTPIGELVPGLPAQVEGVVIDNEITFRPRRQMIVRIADDSQAVLTLRFLNFYGSQTRQLAAGARVRARGDVRGGFLGMEMVHPAYRIVHEGDPLPEALTPVYPSTAGVSQAYLRKAIDHALERTPLPEILPAPVAAEYLAPMQVPAPRRGGSHAASSGRERKRKRADGWDASGMAADQVRRTARAAIVAAAGSRGPARAVGTGVGTARWAR